MVPPCPTDRCPDQKPGLRYGDLPPGGADGCAAPPCVRLLRLLGCITGQDPSFQELNLMKTIVILRRTAVIIEDRTK